MTNEAQKYQLDHATARIITELAAALLPHLKETVSAELTKTIESLPINVDQEVEEAISSLKRLLDLFEDMAKTLNSAQASALLISNELLPLSSMCETLKAATERLEELTAKLDTNDAEAANELLRSLETSLSDWGGIMKANGRAHTKELSEFSAEVSEQVRWMKSSMPGMVEDILERILSLRTEEWSKASGESVRALETKLTRLEKIGKVILAEGFVIIVFLTAAAAAFYFKLI